MLQKNYIVLYKNQPAIVTEVAADKFVIEYNLTQGKKTKPETQRVRSKDVVLLSPSDVSVSLDVLFSEASRLNGSDKEKLENQLSEMWELLGDEETAEIAFAELCTLFVGDFSAKESWGLYQFLHESVLFSESLHDDGIFFSRRSVEEIAKLKEKLLEKERGQELRLAFIERLKTKNLILPDDAKFMQEIEALALGKSDKSKILKECGIAETEENAHRLLIDTRFWPYWKNPYPSRFGFSAQLSGEFLPQPQEEERLHVSHTAYAVDNEWSNVPDDAVAFDGEYLWIHIADPACAVKPDSSIDISARNRGATLYLPETTVRMLVEESPENYALGLTEESKALSFRIKLGTDGSIEETSVYKTAVHVKRLTYAQADEQAETAELKPLFDIAEQNVLRRKAAGAVFIQMPEIHLYVDLKENQSESPEIAVEEVSKTRSSEMVREMMLLAGEAAARFAFKHNIPFPFISQEAPDLPDVISEGLAGQYRLRSSMRSRSIGVVPADHAGLGLGMYSQVTSPLRRYSDLAAHQQLRAYLDGTKLLDKNTLQEHILTGDAAYGASVKAERKSRLHWTLCYLRQHQGWSGKGVVVDIKGKNAVVVIPSLGLETQVDASGVRLNDSLELTVASLDIPKLSVMFSVVC